MAKKKAKPAKKAAPKKSAPKKAPAKKSLTKKAVKTAKPAKKATPKAAKKAQPKAKPVKASSAKAKSAKTKPAVGKVVSTKAAAKLILKPLDDRIVIQIKEMAKRTPGGLYIPDTADVSGNFQGTVLAVGQGHKNKKGKVRPMDVKPGDEVLFDQHSGSKLNLNGEDVRILRESEVLGIVETK